MEVSGNPTSIPRAPRCGMSAYTRIVARHNEVLILFALLALGALSVLWAFSAHGGVTRRVSRSMEWLTDQHLLPPYSPERRLPPVPDGAVRLRFVAAPNTYIVADYPGLFPFLRRLNKREISVEFQLSCALWGGTPAAFNVTSVAGFNVERLASNTGGVESIGHDLDPFGGACEWW